MASITTEHEWLACEEPRDLRRFCRGRVDVQRFRYLAVEWCRRIRSSFQPEDLPWVEAYIAWVEGQGERPVPDPEQDYRPLVRWLDYVQDAIFCADFLRADDPMTAAACAAESEGCRLRRSASAPLDYAKSHRKRSKKARQQTEADERAAFEKHQEERQSHQFRVHSRFCAEFRDVAGNPFRPVTLRPEWLSGTVTDLAQGIDAGQTYDVLPVLADALEEAGCDSAELLSHCRGPGPHVRGCWAIDLLLGRCTIGANPG